MSHFDSALKKAMPRQNRGSRRWVLVLWDQLSGELGPLGGLEPGEAGIVLLESGEWLRRRPWHKQRIALILANQRHFALEQARRGVAVRYVRSDLPPAKALLLVARELGPLLAMEPAERELRAELAPLREKKLLSFSPHTGWLTTRQQFEKGAGSRPPWRMDAFYRHLRRETGILMKDGKPLGGQYSLDAENREPWRGSPTPPEFPGFPTSRIKEEVCKAVERDLTDHPGALDPASLPATAQDAQALWEWAKSECLTHFGTYEDAMSTRSSGLFHTRVSSLLNIHRLLPEKLLQETLELDIPLNSKEGFVRQLLGWREFVKHVHDATDGLRNLDGKEQTTATTPGDAGYARWAGRKWKAPKPPPGVDGGSLASVLGADEPLPTAFWGTPSGMNCLDTVVRSVWDTGWSHHITRLMVLSNIAALLDVSPRELTDWFWVAYTDAWDWVVEPNVLGMGTFAVGEVFTTKPYIAGSAYLDRMSDYCKSCRFSPKTNCPLKRLYWAYLQRHEKALSSNRRLLPVLRSLQKRKASDRRLDARTWEWAQRTLRDGGELTPEDAVGPE